MNTKVNKKSAKVKCLRYIYMLEVDNRGRKSMYFGQNNILYTGQTINLTQRVMQHLSGIQSQFLSKNFGDAQKKLVFVKQLFGNEYDAMHVEGWIKKMDSVRKRKLIVSGENDLINYVPLKVIILRKFEHPDEQVALKFTNEVL